MPRLDVTQPPERRPFSGERSLTISRPAQERDWRRRRFGGDQNLHGNSIGLRKLRLEVDGRSQEADHRSLPFEDGSIDAIRLFETLEHVRDDLALYAELARVLRIGGVLSLRLPNTSPLAGIDSLNLYKYFTDVAHRGLRVPATEEIGFRRHLPAEELAEALGPGFDVVRVETDSTGIGELLNASLLIGTTLFNSTPDRYFQLKPIADTLARLDSRIRFDRNGFWLSATAMRVEP